MELAEQTPARRDGEVESAQSSRVSSGPTGSPCCPNCRSRRRSRWTDARSANFV